MGGNSLMTSYFYFMYYVRTVLDTLFQRGLQSSFKKSCRSRSPEKEKCANSYSCPFFLTSPYLFVFVPGIQILNAHWSTPRLQLTVFKSLLRDGKIFDLNWTKIQSQKGNLKSKKTKLVIRNFLEVDSISSDKNLHKDIIDIN